MGTDGGLVADGALPAGLEDGRGGADDRRRERARRDDLLPQEFGASLEGALELDLEADLFMLGHVLEDEHRVDVVHAEGEVDRHRAECGDLPGALPENDVAFAAATAEKNLNRVGQKFDSHLFFLLLGSPQHFAQAAFFFRRGFSPGRLIPILGYPLIYHFFGQLSTPVPLLTLSQF